MYFTNREYTFNLNNNIVLDYLLELKNRYSLVVKVSTSIDRLINYYKLFYVRKLFRG